MLTQNKFRRARTTSATSTSFTAKVPTSTEPTHSAASGIYDLYDDDLGVSTQLCGKIPRYLLLMPFGTDGDNDTFSMRVWSWVQVTSGSGDHGFWVPQCLAEIAVVLGNISFSISSTTHLMADTLTLTKGDTSSPIINNANDTPACIMLDLKGARKIEFDFDLAGAQEGVAMNCYWRAVDDNAV